MQKGICLHSKPCASDWKPTVLPSPKAVKITDAISSLPRPNLAVRSHNPLTDNQTNCQKQGVYIIDTPFLANAFLQKKNCRSPSAHAVPNGKFRVSVPLVGTGTFFFWRIAVSVPSDKPIQKGERYCPLRIRFVHHALMALSAAEGMGITLHSFAAARRACSSFARRGCFHNVPHLLALIVIHDGFTIIGVLFSNQYIRPYRVR